MIKNGRFSNIRQVEYSCPTGMFLADKNLMAGWEEMEKIQQSGVL